MKKSNQTLTHDQIMWETMRNLVTDIYPFKVPLTLSRILNNRDIGALRHYQWPQGGNDTYTKKCFYQLESFLKRYIFERDIYTVEELAQRAEEKFLETQQNIGLPEDLPPFAVEVLQRSQEICDQILGTYDQQRHISLCRWGKHAAFGLPREKSYLDKRVNVLSGTPEQLAWFGAFAQNDEMLLHSIKDAMYRPTLSVEFQTVPKSYKANRVIAPDTVVGGFLSAGMGAYIRERLESQTGIRLASGQQRHKDVARRASIDDRDATIDMSIASDSFTLDHIRLMCPLSWHKALEVLRTPALTMTNENSAFKGIAIPYKSFMLMGSGHTFPLQTLLFYSLAQATCDLAGIRRKPLVYGDDIIIDSRVARTFTRVMQTIGFTINTDKSFLHGPFRESCGGDYFRGVDVRPFMPETEPKGKARNPKLAFILKLMNGFLDKWHEVEIPSVLMYLQTAWETMSPHGIPQGVAGINQPFSALLYETFSIRTVPLTVVRKPGILKFSQRILKHTGPQRKIESHDAHYWLWLRNSFQREDQIHSPFLQVRERRAFSDREPSRSLKKYRYKWMKNHIHV